MRLTTRSLLTCFIALLLIGTTACKAKSANSGDIERTANLRKDLQDESVEVRRIACQRLSDEDTTALVPDLAQALKDKDSSIRMCAIAHLMNMVWRQQPEAKLAVPALIDVIKDKTSDVRVLAVASLGSMREGASEAVPALISMLQDRSDDNRIGAARALGMIGDERAIEPLTEASKDKDEEVKEAAAAALKAILEK